MKEIWKDVVGFEGLYQVSNIGRVKSLPKEWVSGNGGIRRHNGKILNIRLSNKGYTKVKLSKDGKRTHTSVHRLVAKAFIPNPDNKPQVNHINGIKTDNRISNLEWATAQENVQHSFDTKLNVQRKGKESPCSKAIIQRDLDDNFIKEYGSINQACIENGFNSFGIIKCCKKEKKYNTAYNYKWEYV